MGQHHDDQPGIFERIKDAITGDSGGSGEHPLPDEMLREREGDNLTTTEDPTLARTDPAYPQGSASEDIVEASNIDVSPGD